MPDYSKGKIYKILNNIDDEIYVGSTTETLGQRMAKHRHSIKAKPQYNLYNHMHELGVENFYIELIENYPCNDVYELRAREGHVIRQIGTLNKRIAGRTYKEWYDDNTEVVSQKRKEHRQNNLDDVRARDREYRQQNIERERERDRNKYANNEEYREKVKQSTKKWKQQYPEYVKEQAKQWTENNKEYKAQLDKKYREAHKEQLRDKQKKWCEENRERVKETAKQYREEHKEELAEKLKIKLICECGRELRKSDLKRHLKTNIHKELMEQQTQ